MPANDCNERFWWKLYSLQKKRKSQKKEGDKKNCFVNLLAPESGKRKLFLLLFWSLNKFFQFFEGALLPRNEDTTCKAYRQFILKLVFPIPLLTSSRFLLLSVWQVWPNWPPWRATPSTFPATYRAGRTTRCRWCSGSVATRASPFTAWTLAMFHLIDLCTRRARANSRSDSNFTLTPGRQCSG